MNRCPFATWRPGLATKVGYSWAGVAGLKRGEVKHSAEGYWPGIHAGLDNPNRRASWHFTVGYDRIEQHYEIDAHCWHAGDVGDDGGVAANLELIGVEHLGLAHESLTAYQVDATTRLTRWLAEQWGVTPFVRYGGTPPPSATWVLAEHNEVSDTYTACPSGRIPWDAILVELNGGNDVDNDVRQWLVVAALFQEAAAWAVRGKPLPAALQAQLRYLLASVS